MLILLKRYWVQITIGTVAILLIGGLTLGFVTGAFNQGPAKGWVTNKEYNRDWIQTIPMQQHCSGTGTTKSCYWQPQQTIYHGPSWELEIDDRNGNKGWRDVDQQTYHRCQVNQYCDTRE